MRAVNIFNELPRQLRDIDGTQYTKFKKEARNYFLKVSQERILNDFIFFNEF